MQKASIAAAAVQNGGIAMVSFDSFQLARNDIKGLVPRDSLESALPPGTDSLHGVLEAVGVVYPLAKGAAPQTGAIPLITLNSDNDSLFDMALERTPPPTVM